MHFLSRMQHLHERKVRCAMKLEFSPAPLCISLVPCHNGYSSTRCTCPVPPHLYLTYVINLACSSPCTQCTRILLCNNTLNPATPPPRIVFPTAKISSSTPPPLPLRSLLSASLRLPLQGLLRLHSPQRPKAPSVSNPLQSFPGLP